MKRPMVFISISLILGVVLGRYISKMEYIAFVLVVIMCGCFWAKKKISTDMVFIVPIFMMIGIFVFGLNLPDNPKYENEVTIAGTVENIELTSSGLQSVDFKAYEIIGDNKKSEVVIRVRVYMEKEIEIGDILKLEGYLNLPEPPSNDGGFDNYAYLNAQGYDYSLNAKSIRVIGKSPLGFYQQMNVTRRKMSKVFDEIFPPKEASIVKAMVLGESSSVDSELRQLYANSGIAHVLAVSGMHIGIISSVIVWCFDKLKVNKRKSSIIIVAMLWLYALFVGMGVSVTRAVMMVSVMLLARLFERKGDALSSLGFASIIILLINPWQLWDIGFQLSFSAVLTLLLSGKIFKIENNTYLGKIKTIFVSSFCVSVATAPIVAWHFYQVSVFGCLSNVLVVPIIGFAVIFAMISGIVGLINITLSAYIGGGITFIILEFYEMVCRFFTSLPFATILIGRPQFISIILFYVMLLVFYLTKTKKIKSINILIVVTNLLLMVTFANRLFFKVNTMDFLYVGQGDCAVLRTYDNRAYVFDTGGYANSEIGKNTGVQVIIPYLESHGIKQIDGLFISHMDSDHALGAIELLKYFEVQEVFVSDFVWENKNIYNQILSNASEKDITVYKLSQGSEVYYNNLQIYCIYPQKTTKVDTFDDNDGSLVLKLMIGETDFLFTGDIGAENEKELLNSIYYLGAEVLKVSHHGSKYSSTANFLEAVKMEYAIVSRGKNNAYGHPDEDVLERIENTGAVVYDTALDGQISVKTDGQKIWIETKKEKD